MINRKLKTLIATLAITSLSSNIAFAEIMNLRNPTSSESTSPESSQKIDIVKSQTTQTTINISGFSGSLHDTGKPNNGSKGVTIGAAYLTPDKKFGYMYVNNYDYDGSGTVTAYSDAFASSASNMWGGSVNSGGGTSNNRLYEKAKNYFVGSNSNAYKAIAGVTKEGLQNGAYNIQKADDGRTFVASTFYVRYTYDIADGNSRTNPYETSSPILSTSFTNGPYVAMGDYFDETLDVIADSSARGKIQTNSNYLKSLSSLGISIPSGVVGLTVDDGFVKVNGSYRRPTSRAVLEKRYEYRRYVENKTEVVDNPAEYEFVYGVTSNTTKSQTVLPDISPKVSVKSRTDYTDSSNSSIRGYAFDVTINTKDKDNTYQNPLDTYTIRKVSDRPSNEPREDQMDLWHSDLVATLDIVDPSGNSRLYSPKQIGSYSHTVYVPIEDIKPNTNGSKSLDDCTVKVKLEFKNNARFMVNKEVYNYRYDHNGTNATYNEIINYIDSKPTGLQLKTDIQNYQTSTDPREVLTYKTETSANRSVEASSGIFSITSGDYANATVTVGVNPPNALTVLEGGEFDVNININTNGVPIGNNGSDTWISDFKIDEVLVTSASGDTIYRETNIPISQTSSTVIEKQIHALTAKPTHIGQATVKVTYSYIINKQTYRRVPIEDSGRLDSNGNMIWDYETIREPIIQMPQNGSAQNYFNIYSLSGNTVS